MKTVVIIPTYNEAGNVDSIVSDVFKYVPDASVLIVDDNSPDGTAKRVEARMKQEPRLSLLSRKGKEGLGKAYGHAFREVLKDPSVECLVMMDADHSHDPAYLPNMLAAAATHDMVVGSRYIPGGDMEGWELWRRLLSTFGNYYCRFITGMPVNDSTAGFNVIRADALRKVPITALDNSGYAFQIELKHLLWKNGARLLEMPILFKNRKEGESKISGHIVREGLIAPWKLRFRK